MHFLPCCSDHRSLQLVSVVTMRQAVQREHLCGFIKANHLPLAASHLRHVCWVRLLHVHAAKRHSRMCFFLQPFEYGFGMTWPASIEDGAVECQTTGSEARRDQRIEKNSKY